MDIFNPVSNFFSSYKTIIDNGVFRLHYRLTVMLLLACAIATSWQFFGSPINCSVDHEFDDQHKAVMDTFCWIQSTFTVPHLLTAENIAWAQAHPGVRPVTGPEDKVQYHKYYQWVVFFLIFQALMFYTPFYIWRTIEGGRLEMLVWDLNQETKDPVKDNQKKLDEIPIIANYYVKTLSENQPYFTGFLFCEILNFVNVIGQIFFTDMFLGYEFTTYGTQVLDFVEMDSNQRMDPMDRIFPKISKCTFNKYGASGSIINFDGICVLPSNILNEKIYIFLWFWFIILAIISALGLIYRAITIFAPVTRLYLLNKSVTFMTRGYERSRKDVLKRQQQHLALTNDLSQTGDWFLLYQLGKNLHPITFGYIVEDIGNLLKNIVKKREEKREEISEEE